MFKQPSGTRRNTAARQLDAGFTLIEVLVALVVLTVVFTAVGTGIVGSIVAERQMISKHRAQALAEQTLSKIDLIPLSQLGHYADDGAPDTYLPPYELCRAAANHFYKTCNSSETVYPFILPDNRPAGYAANPPLEQEVTIDDSARGGAKRTYTIRTYLTTDQRALSSGSNKNHRQYGPDTAFVIVSWTERGKTLTYPVRRQLGTTEQQLCDEGFGTFCTDMWATSTGGTWSAGEYTEKSNTSGGKFKIPTALSGTNLITALPVTVRVYAKPKNTNITGLAFDWIAPTGFQIKPLGSTTSYTMTKLSPGVWTYTIYAGTMFDPYDSMTDITGTWSNGTTATSYESVTPMMQTAVPLKLTGITAAGATNAPLPAATGTPTGSLRINTADNNTLSGTVTPRLCTKPDGSLWFNQKLYVDSYGNDPQDWDLAAPPVNNVVYYEFDGSTKASTLAAQTPERFNAGNFQKSGTGTYTPYGSRFVSTLSGTYARGSLTSVSRWALLFPTSAYATLKGFTDVQPYPKFFTNRVEVELTVTRLFDGKQITEMVSIPVYRSNTGTVADCTTGTAAQPIY